MMTNERAIALLETGGQFPNTPHTIAELDEACNLACHAIRRITEYDKAVESGRLTESPCKQYTTVYYICDNRVYVGWYLAKVGETTHLILQDRHEMGICWVTDGFWFYSNEEAEKTLDVLRGKENG